MKTPIELRFTRQVLGPMGSVRLERHLVTQTLCSANCAVVKAEAQPGDALKILLDGQEIGPAVLESVDKVKWCDLRLVDAVWGGFERLSDLADALRKGGYRFQTIDTYNFYRIRFQWPYVERPPLQYEEKPPERGKRGRAVSLVRGFEKSFEPG